MAKQQITITVEQQLLDAIELYRQRQSPIVPSRNKVIELLLKTGLEALDPQSTLHFAPHPGGTDPWKG